LALYLATGKTWQIFHSWNTP